VTGTPSRPPAPFSGKVLVERDRGVMTITISRPEVRNAIDAETARGLAVTGLAS